MPRENLRSVPAREAAAADNPPVTETPGREKKKRNCTKCGKAHFPPTGLKCAAQIPTLEDPPPVVTEDPPTGPSNQTGDLQIRQQLLQQQLLAQQQALQLQQLQQQLAEQQARSVPPVTEQVPNAVPPRAPLPPVPAVTEQARQPVPPRSLPAPAPPALPPPAPAAQPREPATEQPRAVPAEAVPPGSGQAPGAPLPRLPAAAADPTATAIGDLTAGITAAITQTLLPSLTQTIQQAFSNVTPTVPSSTNVSPATVLGAPSTSARDPAAQQAGPSNTPFVPPDFASMQPAPDTTRVPPCNTDTDPLGAHPTGTFPQQLRQDQALQQQVTGRLTSIGYTSDPSTTASSTAANKGKGKSGREKTASDLVDVDVEQFWPHLQVRGEQGIPINYEDLTFAQFVQGHTQIIKDTTDPELKLILLNHLQELASDVDSFPWEWVRGYHAAVLSAMERKWLTWQTPSKIQKLRNQELVMKSAKQAAQGQNGAAVPQISSQPQYYKSSHNAPRKQDLQICMPYQQGQCPQTRDHNGLKHVCHYCWENDGNKFPHTEAACKKKISRRNRKNNPQDKKSKN